MRILTPLLVRGLGPLAAITLATYHSVCHATDFPLWDDDWDGRNAEFLAARGIEMKAEHCLYRGPRIIFLVRTGEDDKRCSGRLSDLGREQSAIVGRRLQHLGQPYTSIIHSSVSGRSTETAKIIAGYLRYVELKPCDLIHDGYPIEPLPLSRNLQVSDEQYEADGARLETAFRNYFYRPDVGGGYTCEVMVCPANVIRYFICRVLQFPPEAWVRITLFHCSITSVHIHGDGQVTVRGIGDFSHLPEDKVTPRLRSI